MTFATYSLGGRGLQLSGTIASNSPSSMSSVITSIPPTNLPLIKTWGKVGQFEYTLSHCLILSSENILNVL